VVALAPDRAAVRRVAAASRSLARGLHPDRCRRGCAELATLATAFNDLASSSRVRGRPSGTSALRQSRAESPLTAIRGYAEALQDGAIDPEERASTVAVEAARLERLVGDLLDLARMNRTDFSVHNSEMISPSRRTRFALRSQADAFGVTLGVAAEDHRRRSPSRPGPCRWCRTSSRTRCAGTARRRVRVVTAAGRAR